MYKTHYSFHLSISVYNYLVSKTANILSVKITKIQTYFCLTRCEWIWETRTIEFNYHGLMCFVFSVDHMINYPCNVFTHLKLRQQTATRNFHLHSDIRIQNKASYQIIVFLYDYSTNLLLHHGIQKLCTLSEKRVLGPNSTTLWLWIMCSYNCIVILLSFCHCKLQLSGNLL